MLRPPATAAFSSAIGSLSCMRLCKRSILAIMPHGHIELHMIKVLPVEVEDIEETLAFAERAHEPQVLPH